MHRTDRCLIVLLVLASLAGACSRLRASDPVEVLNIGQLRGGMPMSVGDSMGFGVTNIRSTSSTPVTDIKATLVPDGRVYASVVDVYAVEAQKWNVRGLGVTKWATVAAELKGHEIPLGQYVLTASSGEVGVLFRVRASGAGRSDWSHIDLSYKYLGSEYSQIVNNSLTVCTPVTLECD